MKIVLIGLILALASMARAETSEELSTLGRTAFEKMHYAQAAIRLRSSGVTRRKNHFASNHFAKI